MNKTPLPSPGHVRAPGIAHDLSERYFRAETSAAEEEWLRHFVLSPQGSGPEWDELRAVLSFTAMGRQLHHATRHPMPATAVTGRCHRPLYRAAAVLAVALLGTGAWWTAHRTTDEPADVCVAYVGGQRITDRAQVMALMHESMSDIGTAEADELLRDNLSGMLHAPEE